ncbi:unnamed protein product [Didymodactylos carnosus]|uniref:FAD linked oxidase N-terminal domain-containing protein n=1 Tax=Didymodactylos carnosus TaxID=1234261 RepID=A0A8S2E377_9BILA|nr:unnamed protein product [Didymodactylos carnosus]CAF3895550.1 unnamed protein product [Didymodactylos carnosus]
MIMLRRSYMLLLLFLLMCSINALSYSYSSYQLSINCTASKGYREPRTTEDIIGILKAALVSKSTVKVLSTHHHSHTGIICTGTNGYALSLIHFSTKYILNKDKLTVTVGAGMELGKLLKLLHQDGYGLENMPAYGGITTGGLFATGKCNFPEIILTPSQGPLIVN